MKKLIFLLAFGWTILAGPFSYSQGETSGPEKQEAATTEAPQAVTPEVPAPAGDLTGIDVPDSITVEWLLNPQNGVFSAGLLLIMYLSGFIPILNGIDDKRRRALVVGLILAAAVVVWQLFQKDLSWTDFFGLAVSFIVTQLGYIFVLAPAGAVTPTPAKT